MVSGFLSCFELKSALAELRRATSGFEAVLLALLHSGVAGQQTGLLQNGTHLIAVLQQGAGDAVTDSAGLAGNAAASDGANDIKLAQGIGKGHGLTNDQLQSFEAEVLIDVTAIDGEGTGAVLMFGLLDTVHAVYGNRTTFSDIRVEAYKRFTDV